MITNTEVKVMMRRSATSPITTHNMMNFSPVKIPRNVFGSFVSPSSSLLQFFSSFCSIVCNIRYLNVHSTSRCINAQLHNDSVFSEVQIAFYQQTIKWCDRPHFVFLLSFCTSMQILNNNLLTHICSRKQGDFPYLWSCRQKYLIV